MDPRLKHQPFSLSGVRFGSRASQIYGWISAWCWSGYKWPFHSWLLITCSNSQCKTLKIAQIRHFEPKNFVTSKQFKWKAKWFQILRKTELGEYFFPQHFQSGCAKIIRTICKGFLKCFHVSTRVSKRFKVPGIDSNILRNKSALIMGICTTFTCFQTLRPRKRGSLHETGFLWIERASISITWNRGKCGDIHTSKIHLKRAWLLAQAIQTGHEGDQN